MGGSFFGGSTGADAGGPALGGSSGMLTPGGGGSGVMIGGRTGIVISTKDVTTGQRINRCMSVPLPGSIGPDISFPLQVPGRPHAGVDLQARALVVGLPTAFVHNLHTEVQYGVWTQLSGQPDAGGHHPFVVPVVAVVVGRSGNTDVGVQLPLVGIPEQCPVRPLLSREGEADVPTFSE